MMTQKQIDHLQEKALTQLKSGQSLFGKDGAFAPMLKGFIEAALEAEMEAHLDTPSSAKAATNATAKAPKRLRARQAVSRLTRLRIARAVLIRSSLKSVRRYWPTAWPTKLSGSTG
jgi:transposase-like protein